MVKAFSISNNPVIITIDDYSETRLRLCQKTEKIFMKTMINHMRTGILMGILMGIHTNILMGILMGIRTRTRTQKPC